LTIPLATFFLVFATGVLSILSPCVLPLIPAYLGFLTGMTPGEMAQGEKRGAIMRHAVAFLLGFSLIFLALGALADSVQTLLTTYNTQVRYVGAALLLVLGLSTLNILKIPFLKMEARVQFSKKPAGYLGSAVVGLAFAAGWSPCLGPFLSTALSAAASSPGQGIPLLALYVLGFSIPFLLFAFFFGSSRKLNRYTPIIERVGGVMMIIAAVLLVTNGFSSLSIWLTKIVGFQSVDELFKF